MALFFMAGAAKAANVANSSFETLSAGFPVNWTKAYANGYESSSTTRNYTGSRSIKINDTANNKAGGVRSDNLRIVPGRQYIATIRCYLETGTSASLYLEYRDSAGVLIQAYAETLTTTGSWQNITVIPEDPTTKAVAVAPAGAVYLSIMAYSPAAQVGISYFDSPTVTEVAHVPVPNHSFETLASGFPTNWTKPYANGYESSSTTQAYLGTKSLKINDTSGSLPGAVRSDPIPVIPGRKYSANIKCYLATGTTASLYLEYWNAQGTLMMAYAASLTDSGSWQNITVIPQNGAIESLIAAPYGASYLTIMAYSSAGQSGITYFDSASVIVDHIDFATAGVVAANPSFENVDGSGFPLEWTKYAGNGFESGSTATVHQGSRSLKINDTSSSAVGGALSKKFSVIEGKTYTATAKVNVQSGTFHMYVQYFDNESDMDIKAYTPDEYLGAVAVASTGTGTWETLTKNFTPPFLAKYAAILLYSNTANTGTAYFDSVTLAAEANGLSNGTFENLDLNGYPHSWGAYLNTANVTTASSTTRFSDIARSLKLSDSSASESGGTRSNRITTVTAGKAYTATSRVYLDSGTAYLYIEFWDSTDTRIGVSNALVSTTGSWQTATVTDTAPTGTVYATVMPYSTVGGTCVAYFDTVTFQEEVVNVTNRRQLFIDDYIIKDLTNVTKTLNQGTKMGQIITPQYNWEGNIVYCYGSFLYDAGEATAYKYKLYYTSIAVDSGGVTRYLTCFAHSTDAATWVKPLNLGVYSWNGSTNNNIVGAIRIVNGNPPEMSGAGIAIAINPNETDPDLKFRSLGKYYRDDSDLKWWYQTYTSSDGKTFIDGIDIQNGWDVATMAYDTFNSKFVGSVKYYDNVRRVHRMMTSSDGVTWSTPVRNESLADTVDTVGYLESDSYGLGWYPYEGVYIGFNWVFHITAGLTSGAGAQDGPVEPQLIFSRDLAEAWYRPSRTPIIPFGASGTWDDGTIYTASYATRVGDEVFLYYGGFDEGHGAGSARVGLAKWRLDGFMSLNSGGTEGTVLTKKLTFTGSSLKLNVNSSGAGNYVKVELLDSSGSVISGYSAANSAVINTDNINTTVTWGGSSNISALAGQTIQVKFYTKNAKLYALQFQ